MLYIIGVELVIATTASSVKEAEAKIAQILHPSDLYEKFNLECKLSRIKVEEVNQSSGPRLQ